MTDQEKKSGAGDGRRLGLHSFRPLIFAEPYSGPTEIAAGVLRLVDSAASSAGVPVRRHCTIRGG